MSKKSDLKIGLEQSARGELIDLGSFAHYVEEEDGGELGI